MFSPPTYYISAATLLRDGLKTNELQQHLKEKERRRIDSPKNITFCKGRFLEFNMKNMDNVSFNATAKELQINIVFCYHDEAFATFYIQIISLDSSDITFNKQQKRKKIELYYSDRYWKNIS